MIVAKLIFFLWIRTVEKIKCRYRFCSNLTLILVGGRYYGTACLLRERRRNLALSPSRPPSTAPAASAGLVWGGLQSRQMEVY